MHYVSKLSMKSKLIVLLVSISAFAVGSVGYFAHSYGEQALTESVFKQLTSVRTTKARQIEDYVERIRTHVASLSEDYMVVSAMRDFATGFSDLEDVVLEPGEIDNVTAFYRGEMLPRLASHVTGEPLLERYIPKDVRSLYLQNHYIASNPHPIDDKAGLDTANDGSTYSNAHLNYHPVFRNLVQRFGYYDLFLIDAHTGDIVYTVFKETDFASNLLHGAYTQSGLARVFKAVQNEPDRGFVAIEDYSSYRPSHGAPAAFMASPIFDGVELIGILAIQLPIDKINRLMTGDRQWSQDGLGETGETYIVGRDMLMRSDSRFLIEQPDSYLHALKTIGIDQHVINRIHDFNTTILQQEVRTEAVKEALASQSGTRIIRDYRNERVLSSYAPLDIAGVNWVIISEIDLAEINTAIASFSRITFILIVVVIVLVTIAAMWVAESFTRPLRLMILEARQIAAGELDRFGSHYQVDFGSLARSFNKMLGRIDKNVRQAGEQTQRYDKLLTKVLPQHIAMKLLGGEETIAERHSNVSVLSADISGFSRLADAIDPDTYTILLNDLINELDESACKHGIEKIKSRGCDYLAVSGMSVVRLDHANCSMEFAQDIFKIVARFNRNRQLNLQCRIGIASGTVIAYAIGRHRLVYDLAGQATRLAYALQSMAIPGTINVSAEIYETLCRQYDFQAEEPFDFGDGIQRKVWTLKSPDNVKEEGILA